MDTFLSALQTLCHGAGFPWGLLLNDESRDCTELQEPLERVVSRGVCSRTGEPWIGFKLVSDDGTEKFDLILHRTTLVGTHSVWMVRQTPWTIHTENEHRALEFLTKLLAFENMIYEADGRIPSVPWPVGNTIKNFRLAS